MKKLILMCACFITVSAIAQDSTNVKPKTWLGVLTLTDKYKDEKNWARSDRAIIGQNFKGLVKYKNEGVIVLAGRIELDFDNPEMKGLFIFYAKDEKEALQFMMDDPAVKNKIMLTKVFPYGIAINKCDN